MRIELYAMFRSSDRADIHGKKIDYWKHVLLSFRKEYGDEKVAFSDKKFREWLHKNWSIKLMFRSRKAEHWTEKIRYASSLQRIRYVHALIIPDENISMLLIKFPTTLFGNKEELGEIKHEN